MKELCGYCFRNLGVGTRLKIYQYLERNGEKNVTAITAFIKLRQPTVSYHLKNMFESGLLNRRNVAKEAFYSTRSTCPHDDTDCVLSATYRKSK